MNFKLSSDLVIQKNFNFKIPADFKKIVIKIIPGLKDIDGVSEIIDNLLALCFEKSKVSYIYKFFKINKIISSNIYLQEDIILSGSNISKILTGSDYALIYAITLGKEIDNVLSTLCLNKNSVKEIIFNYISNFYIQIAAIILKREIIKSINLPWEYSTTCSYSPGNNGWNFQDQDIIFNILNSHTIGLSLNENFFLYPQKSITGAFGVGLKNKIFPLKHACILCKQENCFLKNIESFI